MIDNNQQKLLRQKYNPDYSPLRIHQMKMLKMLSFFDKICKDNGIKYWLSSGTCLGAVRHGGFIPWDDDMDVEMLREDYLKLEKVFQETDQYVFQTYKNDKYYGIVFAKMRDKRTCIYDSLYKYKGVFIDVFCLEHTPRFLSKMAEAYRRFTIDFLYDFLKKHRNRRLLFIIISFLYVSLKYVYFVSLPIFRFAGFFVPHKKLRHCYGVGWADNYREEADIFPLKSIEFEGMVFPVPGNYDKYLSKIYGNYMSIPDENDIPKAHAQFLK